MNDTHRKAQHACSEQQYNSSTTACIHIEALCFRQNLWQNLCHSCSCNDVTVLRSQDAHACQASTEPHVHGTSMWHCTSMLCNGCLRGCACEAAASAVGMQAMHIMPVPAPTCIPLIQPQPHTVKLQHVATLWRAETIATAQ